MPGRLRGIGWHAFRAVSTPWKWKPAERRSAPKSGGTHLPSFFRISSGCSCYWQFSDSQVSGATEGEFDLA
jgi:hypothetical protein